MNEFECIVHVQRFSVWDKFYSIHGNLFLLLFGYGVLAVLVFLIVKVSQESERSSEIDRYRAETSRIEVEHDFEIDKLNASDERRREPRIEEE